MNWIKCSDKLPQLNKPVLGWSKIGYFRKVSLDCFCEVFKWNDLDCCEYSGIKFDDITHWAEITEIEGPKE